MATEAVPAGPSLSSVPPSHRFANRELSWLDFNARVLALAEDNARPLLERVRFLAIFSNNLDEFFQIRVAGLKEQLSVGLATTSPDGMTAREQLDEISGRVRLLMKRQHQIWAKSVRPRLAAAGISVVDWEDLGGDDRVHLRQTFEKRVFPILTPLSVDPAHPFPYISDLSLNLAVVARDPSTQIRRFARVKVPPNIARLHAVARRRAVHPAGTGDRRQPRHAVPGDGDRGGAPVPGHARPGPGPGDRRSRRPAGRDRVDPPAA